MVLQKVSKFVTPVKLVPACFKPGTGVQTASRLTPGILPKDLDSGFRRNDGKALFLTFCEIIRLDNLAKSYD